MEQKHDQEQNTNFSIKVFLLKKSTQYLDNMISNAITGITFAGGLWLIQRLWGLRLISFNVLDAILLALASIIVVLLLIAGILYLFLNRLIEKYPGYALGIFAGMLVGVIASTVSKEDIVAAFAKTAQTSDKKEQEEKVVAPHDTDHSPDSQ